MTDLKIRRVKDKQETPIKVYELIERKGEIPGTRRELLDVYEDGLSEYRKKKWQKAIDLFEKALKIDPHDGPSITYKERCGAYTQEPPPGDWGGVYTLTAK